MPQVVLKCCYTADWGQKYRVTIRRLQASELLAVWGFSPDDATKPPLPKWLKMRRIGLQRYHGLQTRQTTVGNTTCQVWASPAGSRFDMPDADGQTGDWFTTGKFNESVRKHT